MASQFRRERLMNGDWETATNLRTPPDSVSSPLIIAHQFSKHAITYDRHSDVQRYLAKQTAEEVVRLTGGPRMVLEIGCGTGQLTASLVEMLPSARVVAVDFSEAMLRCARARVPAGAPVEFVVADLEYLGLTSCAFDVAVSSSSLQWMQRPVVALRSLRTTLRRGGVTIHSAFGRRTFREFFSLLSGIERQRGLRSNARRMPLRPAHHWRRAFRHAGFDLIEVRSELLPVVYENCRTFLNSLRGTGAAINLGDAVSLRTLREAIARYDCEFATDTGVTVTYEVLNIVAQRPYDEVPRQARESIVQ